MATPPSMGLDKNGGDLGLWYFQTEPASVASALKAGIATFLVDWECRGKAERQVDFDTEINQDTDLEVRAVKAVPGSRVICRINGFGQATEGEVNLAIEAGADLVLLPMVRGAAEADRFLRWVDGRVAAGVLVETAEALACIDDIADLPLSAAYIGLNDLRISTGAPHIFSAVRGGTVERIAAALHERRVPCGWGGVTLVDHGAPIPARLLMAEMARLGSAFSFVRRSFRRDIVGADLALEVGRIQAYWAALKRRPRAEVEADRDRLFRLIDGL